MAAWISQTGLTVMKTTKAWQCGSDPEVPLWAMVLLASIRRSDTWLPFSGQVCESSK